MATHATTARLNVRSAPQLDAKIVVTLDANRPVDVVEIDGDWAKIEQGYALAAFLQPIAVEEGSSDEPDDEPD